MPGNLSPAHANFGRADTLALPVGCTPAVRFLLRWTLRRPERSKGNPAGAGCARGLDALVLAGPRAPPDPAGAGCGFRGPGPARVGRGRLERPRENHLSVGLRTRATDTQRPGISNGIRSDSPGCRRCGRCALRMRLRPLILRAKSQRSVRSQLALTLLVTPRRSRTAELAG